MMCNCFMLVICSVCLICVYLKVGGFMQLYNMVAGRLPKHHVAGWCSAGLGQEAGGHSKWRAARKELPKADKIVRELQPLSELWEDGQ